MASRFRAAPKDQCSFQSSSVLAKCDRRKACCAASHSKSLVRPWSAPNQAPGDLCTWPVTFRREPGRRNIMRCPRRHFVSTNHSSAVLVLGSVLAVASSCVGDIQSTDSDEGIWPAGNGEARGGAGDRGVAPAPANGAWGTGLRRLTRAELRATIKDLLNVDTVSDLTLLAEEPTPFDNDYVQQQKTANQRYVEGVATVVENAARMAIGNTSLRQSLIGCTPSAACLDQFVSSFGLRALRRPLDADERAELRALAAAVTGSEADFFDGIERVVRVLLQDPEFLYRIEIGAPTDKPNVFRLNGYEM